MRGVRILAMAALSILGGVGCVDPSGAPCTIGTTVRCSCDGSAEGAATCGAAGTLEPCVCEAPSHGCVPGRVAACACPDGDAGTQRCSSAGVFERCVCSLADAGSPHASDAGPSMCDPYVSSTCGCGEEPPPSEPTVLLASSTMMLGSGPETLVDVVPLPGGIVIVLRDEARLVSRDGEMLARWRSERELLWAARDGDQLILGDRAIIITLDAALAERSRFVTREECTRGVLVSCGRIVCVRPGAGPSIHTYDRATGVSLASQHDSELRGTLTRSVPGVDAFITVTVGYSPSDVHYQRVLSNGEITLLGDSPYHGEVVANEVLTFVGWPATHLVTAWGQVLRMTRCPSAEVPSIDGCLSLDGSLEPLAGPGGFLALDGGEDGTLSALAAPPVGVFDLPCRDGCELQRIDVERAAVARERPVSLRAGGFGARLRHDAWSDRAVIATPMSCDDDYPRDCEGWEVRLEAYE